MYIKLYILKKIEVSTSDSSLIHLKVKF